MRIINQPLPGITKAYNQQNKENNVTRTKEASKHDEIEISSEGRFFSTALKALHQLPETEGKNLEKIKKAIKTGTYAVKNEELAEKIWQESFLDKRV